LRTVDERQTLFRKERDRLKARAPKRLPSGQQFIAVSDGRFAFADEHQAEMRERRKIAAGTNRSATRHARVHTTVEQFNQQLERATANPGEPFGQHIGAQRHGRPDCPFRQRLTNSGCVAPQQIQLQRAERIAWDSSFRQRTEPGVDTVHSLVGRRFSIDDCARRINTGGSLGRQGDGLVLVGDGAQLAKCERVAVKEDHQYLSRILQV